MAFTTNKKSQLKITPQNWRAVDIFYIYSFACVQGMFICVGLCVTV